MKSNKDSTITFRIDDDRFELLKIISEFHDRPISHFVRLSLESILQDHFKHFKGYESSLKKDYPDWLNLVSIQNKIALAKKFEALYHEKRL